VVLLLQIEHPKFHTVITHKRPELDAQASIGFYLNWLFDVFQIEEKHDFDWTLNKSWRHVSFRGCCGDRLMLTDCSGLCG
jgi:hypothetical protein